ncbi:Endonuclease/exonuclease/phosphatase [Parasponia andersonii]|uniref:Endonuclease/exonuclease/phosphatase n=1 Tax=Parasponia andersonii TaxID=3476 RepID=A0A2P5CGL2_PARAD|nr:Endonuclease/exonuclease/phosphatase [Parasponia andersonii]
MKDYNRSGESNFYSLPVWWRYARAWVCVDLAFPLKRRVKVRLGKEVDCFWAKVKDEQVVIPKPLRKIHESIARGLSKGAPTENTRVYVNQNQDDVSNQNKILEVSNEGFCMSSDGSIKTSTTRKPRSKKMAWTVSSGRSISSRNVHLRKMRSCLCWNVRGLESPRVSNILWDLLHITSPYFIFLIETKLYGSKATGVVSKLGYDGHMVVDSEVRSGELILLWHRDYDIQFLNFCRWYIDVLISLSTGAYWRFTCFYNDPTHANR